MALPASLRGAVSSLRGYVKQVGDAYTQATRAITSSVTSMETALGGAFFEIISRTKDVGKAFEDMAYSILTSLQQIASSALASQILSSIIGAFVGAGGSSAGSEFLSGSKFQPVGSGGGLSMPSSLGSSLGGAGPSTPSGGGDTYITNYNISISAVDARSVEKLFRDNASLLAALNAEQMEDSLAYRRRIRQVARGK
jgi:hypothetical protein